ncbi:MAG: molybdopterin-binding protein [Butyricicoccus sp.]
MVTTGGTGFAPRDNAGGDHQGSKLAPGIPEAMRAASMQITPKACLSGAAAGIRGMSLIINLPGSPKGACENLQAVLEPIEHGIYILQGGKE